MVEEVNLDGPEDSMSWVKWEAAVETNYSKESLIKKLRHLIEEREIAKRKLPRDARYTYLDAVARQGSHVGLPTVRP